MSRPTSTPPGSAATASAYLPTLATDTHKAESRYLDGLVAPWPEGRAVYEDRSPINHLENLRTPMLILQGSEDKVVPPTQAEQMADAVRSAGQPVALLVFDGEGHGFRTMAARRRSLEAQVSFLEQVFGMPAEPGCAPPGDREPASVAARTEHCGAETHGGGSVRDGDAEVAGHAHAQLVPASADGVTDAGLRLDEAGEAGGHRRRRPGC